MSKYIFMTGAPGSKWSGVSQQIEEVCNFNTSDRNDSRTYKNTNVSHVGAYFGPGMEFECKLDSNYFDSIWSKLDGIRLIKSHNWAYMLDDIKKQFPDSPILFVRRGALDSFLWWKKAGGFDIEYPNYDWYVDDKVMMHEIEKQNQLANNFVEAHGGTWENFSDVWVNKTFNVSSKFDNSKWLDVKVAIVR